MILTPAQKDALTEIINIGFGRAASALSMLVGQRILLEAPDVIFQPVQDLESSLGFGADVEISTVHQVFTGSIAGDAMLIMDTGSAATLVDLLIGGSDAARDLSITDQEMIAETGNILLNAFIGSFGNLLQVHISFTVPQLRMESLKKMLRTLEINNREIEYALIVRVNFRLARGDASGYVIIVMGVQSLDTLMEAIEQAGFMEE